MKLIEALKKIKNLQEKADDLKSKVHTYCADQSHETPTYGDNQKEQIKEWIQSYEDTLKEILRLRVAIQKTNLQTPVTIELGGKAVTKSISEWIHRRRDFADRSLQLWKGIGDRGLREGNIKTSTGEMQEVKIRRYYEPRERDEKVELYRSEPTIIDSVLEVKNAVTDLIET
jgi:gas vesicle protein